jgi:hypothetical protein
MTAEVSGFADSAVIGRRYRESESVRVRSLLTS